MLIHLFLLSLVPSFVRSFVLSLFVVRSVGAVVRALVSPFVLASCRSFVFFRSFVRSIVPPFISSVVRSFVFSFFRTLYRSSVHKFGRSFIFSFFRAFYRSSVHKFGRAFFRSYFQSFIRSFNRPFVVHVRSSVISLVRSFIACSFVFSFQSLFLSLLVCSFVHSLLYSFVRTSFLRSYELLFICTSFRSFIRAFVCSCVNSTAFFPVCTVLFVQLKGSKSSSVLPFSIFERDWHNSNNIYLFVVGAKIYPVPLKNLA